jgi:hypothetical protein
MRGNADQRFPQALALAAEAYGLGRPDCQTYPMAKIPRLEHPVKLHAERRDGATIWGCERGWPGAELIVARRREKRFVERVVPRAGASGSPDANRDRAARYCRAVIV